MRAIRALRVSGEHEFPVLPLSLPERGQGLPVETLAQYGAIELFRQRAAAVDPTFALTPADVKAGIVLSVEGANIIILDIYHRPLKEIHERVLDYWE